MTATGPTSAGATSVARTTTAAACRAAGRRLARSLWARLVGPPDRRQDGFAAVELAILAPFLIVMLLLIVGFGRVSHGRQLVDQAGSAAARAAALTNAPGPASDQAQLAAADTLAQAGVTCRELQVSVSTGAFYPGGYVDVDVTCRSDLSGLALAGLPGSVTLASSSRSPLETYRDLSGTEGS